MTNETRRLLNGETEQERFRKRVDELVEAGLLPAWCPYCRGMRWVKAELVSDQEPPRTLVCDKCKTPPVSLFWVFMSGLFLLFVCTVAAYAVYRAVH